MHLLMRSWPRRLHCSIAIVRDFFVECARGCVSINKEITTSWKDPLNSRSVASHSYASSLLRCVMAIRKSVIHTNQIRKVVPSISTQKQKNQSPPCAAWWPNIEPTLDRRPLKLASKLRTQRALRSYLGGVFSVYCIHENAKG